jgi:hypothetical protein
MISWPPPLGAPRECSSPGSVCVGEEGREGSEEEGQVSRGAREAFLYGPVLRMLARASSASVG